MPTNVVETFPTSEAFSESSTGKVGGQLRNDAGGEIALSAISALVGTLTNHVGTKIRDAQNMLNTNNATVSSTGAFVLELQPADTAAVETGSEYQVRSLALKVTHSSGKVMAKEIRFFVRKLTGHP